MTEVHRTEDQRAKRDERSGADQCWIYRDSYHYPQVTFTRPDPRIYPGAVEYMRVLTKGEVEKLLNSEEGCDTRQYIKSLERQVEGQRKHIARLEAEKKAHRCHHALDEALNTGDGSYRP